MYRGSRYLNHVAGTAPDKTANYWLSPIPLYGAALGALGGFTSGYHRRPYMGSGPRFLEGLGAGMLGGAFGYGGGLLTKAMITDAADSWNRADTPMPVQAKRAAANAIYMDWLDKKAAKGDVGQMAYRRLVAAMKEGGSAPVSVINKLKTTGVTPTFNRFHALKNLIAGNIGQASPERLASLAAARTARARAMRGGFPGVDVAASYHGMNPYWFNDKTAVDLNALRGINMARLQEGMSQLGGRLVANGRKILTPLALLSAGYGAYTGTNALIDYYRNMGTKVPLTPWYLTPEGIAAIGAGTGAAMGGIGGGMTLGGTGTMVGATLGGIGGAVAANQLYPQIAQIGGLVPAEVQGYQMPRVDTTWREWFAG